MFEVRIEKYCFDKKVLKIFLTIGVSIIILNCNHSQFDTKSNDNKFVPKNTAWNTRSKK